MNKEIHIKQGIGDICFDMPIEDVVALLGPASEVETIDNAEDEATTVLRYEQGMTLFFEGDNPVLSCIDITDDEATLFDQDIFGMNEKQLVKLMTDNHYFEQDVDDEDWGERRVTFNEGNIDFYLEDDELMSVIIGK